MKKSVALFAVLLALCLCFPALPGLGEGYTAPGFFSITYDAKAYTLDADAYAEENAGAKDGSRWFFILYNDEMMFDASTTPVESYTGLTLLGADDAARQTYVNDMLDLYGDEDAALLEIVPGGSRQVPFYVFRCRDESGPYLMAETVVSGYAIDFLAYYNDSALAADDALARALAELLATFEPA